MSTIEESIEVQVPIRTAYNQWTQFESFPLFMGAVECVKQLGPDRVHFRMNIAGHVVEYEADIVQQIPDSRIAWQSTAGKETGGVVAFSPIGPDRTRVTLLLHYAPEGAIEKMADRMGIVARQCSQDLKSFKKYIESRGVESGAWRGGIGPG